MAGPLARRAQAPGGGPFAFPGEALIRWWQWSLLALVVALVGFLIWGGVSVRQALAEVEQAREDLRLLGATALTPEQLLALDPALSLQQVRSAHAHMQRARSRLGPLLAVGGGLGWVPWLGPRLSALGDAFALEEAVVPPVEEVLTLLVEVRGEGAAGGLPLFRGKALDTTALERLSAVAPRLRRALEALARARASLERAGGMDGLQAGLGRLEGVLDGLLTASEVWRGLLGYGSPRTYLVVAQNSDELRPSGGFIPGAWVVRLDRGRLEGFRFWDTREVDTPGNWLTPPPGIVQGLWGGYWLFRDAGWYPDFPTSARVMERFFELGPGVSVDGVVSLDQWAIGYVLEALGPVTLPDGTTVDADNYLAVLEQGTDEEGRRYMDALAQGLLDRLHSPLSPGQLAGLLKALLRALEERHILLYFHDPRVQGLVARRGWDGAVRGWDGDYILVADSNVGFSKVNRNIERRLSYRVDLTDPSRPLARLEVLYVNHSRPSRQTCEEQVGRRGTYREQLNACYWNYLRVYVPYGSHLVSATPFPMPEGALAARQGHVPLEDTLAVGQAFGKTRFAGFFTVEIGERRAVAFVYSLPPSVVRSGGRGLVYRLLVQKQAGTLQDPLEVTVALPRGYRLAAASPQPARVRGGEVHFSLSLRRDVSLELVMEAR